MLYLPQCLTYVWLILQYGRSRRNQCWQYHVHVKCQLAVHFLQQDSGTHFLCELSSNIFIHQSHVSGGGLGGTITKRALLHGFCVVLEGNWLMNLNDLQLQLLYLHTRICRAHRWERQAAVTAVGLLPQVLCCVVWRGCYWFHWKQLLY